MIGTGLLRQLLAGYRPVALHQQVEKFKCVGDADNCGSHRLLVLSSR